MESYDALKDQRAKIERQGYNCGPMEMEMAPRKDRRVNLFIEPAEGGAILVAMNALDPSDKRTAIVSGAPDTAAFQRKVQRTFIKWVKEFFPAPARAGSAAAAAQEEANAVAAEEGESALPRADAETEAVFD